MYRSFDSIDVFLVRLSLTEVIVHGSATHTFFHPPIRLLRIRTYSLGVCAVLWVQGAEGFLAALTIAMEN